MRWFRVYSEIKDDPKMLELDDHQFRLWVGLLAMASEGVTARDTGVTSRGCVRASRRKGLAMALRTDEKRLSEALDLFEDLDMIECDDEAGIVCIRHWDARQYDKNSDLPEATRERKRRSRARHADVTPSHALEAEADTDTESDTEGSTADAVDGADIELTPGERRIVDNIRGVKGMAAVSDADVVLHLREVLSARSAPVSEAALILDSMKFREHHNDKRATAPADQRWRGWKNGVTNWFSRTTETAPSNGRRPRTPNYDGINAVADAMTQREAMHR